MELIWRVRPELRRRPWGGSSLAPGWFTPATADFEEGAGPFGEAWLLGPDSRLLGGGGDGRTVAELTRLLGARLIGEAAMTRYGGSFPLLLKLLDAARPLSLQVHPDDAAAQRRGAAMGKSEAWWVLAAEADARLWWGLREPVTALALQQALVEGSVMQLMREVRPQPGMVVVNPAGTVHALGAGVLAFEIQQASDTTYRLFDHGATDAEGRPRPLHIAEALAVAQLHPGKEPAPAARLLAVGRRELVRSDSFVLEDWGAIEPWQQGAPIHGSAATADRGLSTITNLSIEAGTVGVLRSSILREPLEVRRGESVLIAAAAPEVTLEGAGRFAVTRFPG